MIDFETARTLAARIHELKSFDDYEAADLEITIEDTIRTMQNAPEVVIEYLLTMIEDLEA